MLQPSQEEAPESTVAQEEPPVSSANATSQNNGDFNYKLASEQISETDFDFEEAELVASIEVDNNSGPSHSNEPPQHAGMKLIID